MMIRTSCERGALAWSRRDGSCADAIGAQSAAHRRNAMNRLAECMGFSLQIMNPGFLTDPFLARCVKRSAAFNHYCGAAQIHIATDGRFFWGLRKLLRRERLKIRMAEP